MPSDTDLNSGNHTTVGRPGDTSAKFSDAGHRTGDYKRWVASS